MPQLKILDDAPLTVEAEREESSLSSRSTLFSVSEAGVENDWRIVQQSIKQSSLSTSQLLEDEIPNAVSTNVTTTIGEQQREGGGREREGVEGGRKGAKGMGREERSIGEEEKERGWFHFCDKIVVPRSIKLTTDLY